MKANPSNMQREERSTDRLKSIPQPETVTKATTETDYEF